MIKTLLTAIFVLASAAGPSGGLFEVHLATTADAPNAMAWLLRGRGGTMEGTSGQPATSGPRGGVSDAAALGDLQGSWSVQTATPNDPELRNSTWSFHGNTLVVTTGSGQTERSALRMDGGTPRAVHLDPIAPSKELTGWMIFRREGDRLTLAFGDNFEGRPDNFEPARGKIVVTLALLGRGSAVLAPSEGVLAQLRGSWIEIKRTTTGGRELYSGKEWTSIGGTQHDPDSTWIFQGRELLMESHDGRKERFDLRRSATSGPRTFQAMSVGSTGNASYWMIFERDRDWLKIAYDPIENRPPENFEARPGLVVVDLLSKSGMEAREPCGVLLDAGVEKLLGSKPKLKKGPFEAPIPGPICVAKEEEGAGEVTLMFILGSDRSAFEQERERGKSPDTEYQNEPDLGETAISSVFRKHAEVIFGAFKNQTIVILEFKFNASDFDLTALRQFAKRVLAKF